MLSFHFLSDWDPLNNNNKPVCFHVPSSKPKSYYYILQWWENTVWRQSLFVCQVTLTVCRWCLCGMTQAGRVGSRFHWQETNAHPFSLSRTDLHVKVGGKSERRRNISKKEAEIWWCIPHTEGMKYQLLVVEGSVRSGNHRTTWLM